MIVGGALIDMCTPELFTTRGVCIDARGKTALDEGVFMNDAITKGCAVVVCTGWSERFSKESYFDFSTMPFVTPAAAQLLVAKQIRFLMLDTPTPDVAPYAEHKTLLGGGVYIVENVAQTESLLNVGNFECTVVPLRLHADASPVRAYARVFGTQTVSPGVYRHYKGHQYEVVETARHSESLEPLVVYKEYGVTEPKWWVRPAEMFSELVTIDGQSIPRFARIS
jgi:hypothetical protein